MSEWVTAPRLDQADLWDFDTAVFSTEAAEMVGLLFSMLMLEGRMPVLLRIPISQPLLEVPLWTY